MQGDCPSRKPLPGKGLTSTTTPSEPTTVHPGRNAPRPCGVPPVRILVIPDLHAPHAHPDALVFVRGVAKRLRPQQVVCIGDEIDSHAIARWPADPDLDSAGPELTRAVEQLRPWYAAFPRVKVCHSNHTYRPWIRARESGLPSRVIRSPREVLEAPKGWEWAHRWEIDGITFVHGEGYSGAMGALTAAVRNRTRVVIGHLHGYAGAVWSHGWHDAIWGLNVGCLIDPNAPAFAYAKTSPNRPSLGCGVIEDGTPRWIPLS